MNTIVSFKDLSDLSVVLCKMRSRYDVTIRWCFTLVRLSVRSWCSLQIKLPTITTLAAVQADRERPIFPSFNTLLQSILFNNLSRLVLLNMLCWT